MSQPQQMETRIDTYKNAGAMQHHANKLAKQGWTVRSADHGQRNRSLAGKLIVPLGLFTKPAEITVVYERPMQAGIQQQEVMPRGLSFKEQVRWHMEHPKRR
jgi:hypothetical protein